MKGSQHLHWIWGIDRTSVFVAAWNSPYSWSPVTKVFSHMTVLPEDRPSEPPCQLPLISHNPPLLETWSWVYVVSHKILSSQIFKFQETSHHPISGWIKEGNIWTGWKVFILCLTCLQHTFDVFATHITEHFPFAPFRAYKKKSMELRVEFTESHHCAICNLSWIKLNSMLA